MAKEIQFNTIGDGRSLVQLKNDDIDLYPASYLESKFKGREIDLNQYAPEMSASTMQAVSSLASVSYDNGVAKFLANAANAGVQFRNQLSVTSGHRYYMSCMVKLANPSNVVKARFVGGFADLRTAAVSGWQLLSRLSLSSVTGSGWCQVINESASNIGEVQAQAYMHIDLTQMFGDDAPTTIDELYRLIPMLKYGIYLGNTASTIFVP